MMVWNFEIEQICEHIKCGLILKIYVGRRSNMMVWHFEIEPICVHIKCGLILILGQYFHEFYFG